MGKFIFMLTVLCSTSVFGSLSDCKNLYIGRIWVEKGNGLNAVVYLNNRGDSSGSYWSRFTGWTQEEKAHAYSLLLMAKASDHRVNVTTENQDECGLQDGGTVTKSVFLTTNP